MLCFLAVVDVFKLLFPWIKINICSHPLIFQGLLHKIISGVHSAGSDAASSSYAPAAIATKKSVGDLLSEIAPMTPTVVCIFVLGLFTLHVPILLSYCATYYYFYGNAGPCA